MSESRHGPLDLILDIGKTRAKLLVIDESGEVIVSVARASASVTSGPYLSLDVDGVAAWLEDALKQLGALRARLARLMVSAHGAAFALVDEQGLVLPVPDYEFAGFDERPEDWTEQIGAFAETLSPDLPLGLNGATQLDWLERHFARQFGRGNWMPYAQYWSWWFSGVASSEVTSLGCHAHLWDPRQGDFSTLARRRGWAQRFAPRRRAWEVLGPIRPELAARLGLPADLRVHCGVHDSNACLARYLRASPRLTLVTTGTWIVVMAPGAPERTLDAGLDLLGNVSVRQQAVPTGRFMGGRELQRLCAGADPALANAVDLARLLKRGVMALPGFESQGGPFRSRSGCVVDARGEIDLMSLTASERASLAAMYAAQVTAWIVDQLGGIGPVVVEGPFAHNPIYTSVLAALLPRDGVCYSTDELEGTARGAWQLVHWIEPQLKAPPTAPARALLLAALPNLHARWLAALGRDGVEQSFPTVTTH